jgi:UDP-N-acetylmuramoylalanine-D-glutamate ligase
VLDEVDIINGENYDYIVYELSSYMLEVFEPKCFIAIFGNLYECHLAWHKNSFEIYKKAKFNILKNAENILI